MTSPQPSSAPDIAAPSTPSRATRVIPAVLSAPVTPSKSKKVVAGGEGDTVAELYSYPKQNDARKKILQWRK
jgi:hypothetical protein